MIADNVYDNLYVLLLFSGCPNPPRRVLLRKRHMCSSMNWPRKRHGFNTCDMEASGEDGDELQKEEEEREENMLRRRSKRRKRRGRGGGGHRSYPTIHISCFDILL